MYRLILVFMLFFIGFMVQAQNAISGQLPLRSETDGELQVYLTKLDWKDFPDLKKAKPIAVSAVDGSGRFVFKRNLIADKEAVYRVYVARIENILKDTLNTGESFLLSRRDSIRFGTGGSLFSNYTNTNAADREWKKLQKYEASLHSFDLQNDPGPPEDYLRQMKSYTKDSLQILMVKLISIKQLDEKKLLERDIAENPEYYLELLQKLKESELERSAYLFLENKLAFLTTEVVEKEYQLSKLFNIFLSLVTLGLLLLVFQLARRKEQREIPLSRQETYIRDLILAGKSNKDIANELFISLNTVKTHITNIYNKLQVSGRQELIRRNQN